MAEMGTEPDSES